MFPLLSPTTFFLLVVNIVYAFFDTFGMIDTATGGGPDKATEILVYKVFQDGILGADLGGSAAQSVILMVDRDRAHRGPIPLCRAPGALLGESHGRAPPLRKFPAAPRPARRRAHRGLPGLYGGRGLDAYNAVIANGRCR